MGASAVVWFKRDLRLADHAPLREAARLGDAVALYVVEPAWVGSAECEAQHLEFARRQVLALRECLGRRGLPLLVRWGSLPEVLAGLRSAYPFTHLLSHEETGPQWSYDRDRAVARWCREAGVIWRQWPQKGVIRGLRERAGWAARWQGRMDARIEPAPARWRGAGGLPIGEWPDARIRQAGHGAARELPAAGEAAAHDTLASFLDVRGQRYRFDISSPSSAVRACSRLSAHLAFGALSVRQVHQATEARIAALQAVGDAEARSFAYHLRGFSARLRWHCHFMQKLESEPQIEWRNVARVCDGLREQAFDRERFDAWRTGNTGYPMVDACMRCLNATGWINFRMRAMLVSFAAYHLWLHWREPGLHLARQFLDFEPGIHWSQMQMQSGTTGINTLRMYSPARQHADHDPRSEFIRRWLPEYGTAAYVRPIVDERAALHLARQRLYTLRRTPEARREAAEVQRRHGSRRGGLPPTRRRAGAGRVRDADPAQRELPFDDAGRA